MLLAFVLITIAWTVCIISCDANLIRVGLTLDENSAKDGLLLASSIVSSTYFPDQLAFHVVICGRNYSEANLLLTVVQHAFEACIPYIKVEFKPFVLPPESGFAKQRDSVTRRSHWYSPTGADMARFFLPSLFPDVDKILYLDNDIIISCCIEEVYNTVLHENQVVGIALDDLKWATVTQFRRQYNATHPLVIENIRRPLQAGSGSNLAADAVSEDEFWKALPRYPNDGVLLINVTRYNKLKILESADKIAQANARGEYVVGLGTQQFTVLLLHDRWLELTPRANLRHFPDMARGYLMWFLYNGVIHYAGMAKPRAVCFAGSSDNEHRIGTYTPWAATVYRLNQQCPQEILHQDTRQCANHMIAPRSSSVVMDIILKLASGSTGSHASQLVLHIGGISSQIFDLKQQALMTSPPIAGANHSHDQPLHLRSLSRYLFLQAPWSLQVFDADVHRLHQSTQIIRNGLESVSSKLSKKSEQADASSYNPSLENHNLPEEYGSSMTLDTGTAAHTKHRQLLVGTGKAHAGGKSWTEAGKNRGRMQHRRYTLSDVEICDGANDYPPLNPHTRTRHVDCKVDSFINTYESNQRVNAYDSMEICRSILQYIKTVGHKHWDVVGVVIDYHPSSNRPFANSLGVLRNLDLVFMRPKFIVVRVSSPQLHEEYLSHAHSPKAAASDSKCNNPRGDRTLLDDVREVQRILIRSGYEVTFDIHHDCKGFDDDDDDNNNNNDNKRKIKKEGGNVVSHICVWGLRVTTIDLGAM